MRALKSFLKKLRNSAFAPVDIASLVFFRIAFGLIMIWEVCSYFLNHRIAAFWIAPRFLFKYYGFAWVQPWPGNGLYIHWTALGLFALFVAAGFFYRISAALFFLSWTYFFLLDEALWLNHYYLICLFSFLLIFTPANRALSIDAWLNPQIRSEQTPAWTLWLLRVQMGLVYFYGGIAKLTPDWLHGEPMRARLAERTSFPILGRFFHEEWMVYTVSYGGLLLDLLIVPFLLWRRTRVAAFCAAAAFHLLNAQWFSIGVFPWLAISATTLFFSPDWPRRIVKHLRAVHVSAEATQWKLPSTYRQGIVLSFVALYVVIQVLIPLRPFLWHGGVEWTCAEHRFSWRMLMSRGSRTAYFYVTDPNTGKTSQTFPRQFLTDRQAGMIGMLPDYPLQFARYLAKVMPRRGPKPLKVEARIFLSINGRKPELYIDPNVDLAAEPDRFGRPPWLLPIRRPLPPPHSNNALPDPFDL